MVPWLQLRPFVLTVGHAFKPPLIFYVDLVWTVSSDMTFELLELPLGAYQCG